MTELQPECDTTAASAHKMHSLPEEFGPLSKFFLAQVAAAPNPAERKTE